MHQSAKDADREERGRQSQQAGAQREERTFASETPAPAPHVASGSVYDLASYIPGGHAAEKLTPGKQQGATVYYLPSRRIKDEIEALPHVLHTSHCPETPTLFSFVNAPLPVEAPTLLGVLTWLEAAGIAFVLDQSPEGSYELAPPEVLAYLRDPEAFLAAAAGVSVADYRGWKAAQGAIQCQARTRGNRGRRCRNMVAETSHYLTPKQWVDWQARSPTCWVHGGGAISG